MANIHCFEYHFSNIYQLEKFLLEVWEDYGSWFPIIIEVIKNERK